MNNKSITVNTGFNVHPFEVGDEIRILCGESIDELYEITYIDSGHTWVTLSLIQIKFILEKQFNNVLFKMWER